MNEMTPDVLNGIPANELHTRCLTTLNMGLGRDSIAMLCLLIEGSLIGEHGEAILPEHVDAVIFSDTGAEWSHTYKQVAKVRKMCKKHGLRFLVLRKPRKTGPRGWMRNLREKGSRALPEWCIPADRGQWDSIEEKAAAGAYHLRLPIMAEYMRFAKIAIVGSASCTDNHKVGPIRRVINDLSMARFDVGNRSWAHRVKTGTVPKHRVLIGIAADELSRAINTGRPAYERAVYPLVEMGIAKADEAAILERHGFGTVMKSGCFMCPHQPNGWFWALRETRPDLFAQVVEYERAALEQNPKMFVRGGKTITAVVDYWRAKNRSATVAEVLTKAYKRGACKVPINQLGLFTKTDEAAAMAA